MRAHPFDAVSAALALLAVAAGLIVAGGDVDSIDTGWWLALGALVVGLGLVPWNRQRPTSTEHEAADSGQTTDRGTTDRGTPGGGPPPPRLRL